MPTVKLSPKYQIVIPSELRREGRLRPGQHFAVFREDDQIILVPVKPMKQMRGFLKGIKTDIPREEDRF
jgi:AbrB family looped-hinge helix DNA binding protein